MTSLLVGHMTTPPETVNTYRQEFLTLAPKNLNKTQMTEALGLNNLYEKEESPHYFQSSTIHQLIIMSFQLFSLMCECNQRKII